LLYKVLQVQKFNGSFSKPLEQGMGQAEEFFTLVWVEDGFID
jgi:hypothetical protein